MKKPKISFRVIGDSGPVSLSWFQGPKGDAIEAKNGIGVGFFSDDRELLAVEFDDVNKKKDHQVLEFDRYRVEVAVNNGKISYSMTPLRVPKKATRSSKKKTKDAA